MRTGEGLRGGYSTRLSSGPRGLGSSAGSRDAPRQSGDSAPLGPVTPAVPDDLEQGEFP